MIKKLSRLLSLLIINAAVILLASGCSSDKQDIAQSISYNLGMEPDNIDPALNRNIEGANVILACFEGLMRMDKDSKAIPGVAASYTKESDVKYIFKLRDCKWWDGEPVAAADFEYAWKRALSPKTGSENAYQLYCIKGGSSYNNGISGPENVGIRVVDDKTLEVVLEEPTSHFLELLAYPAFMPVRQDIINSAPDTWANEPSTYMGNGPFKLSKWTRGGDIEFVKNPQYYNASRVRLHKLVFRTMADPVQYYEAYEKGLVDIIESPPSAEIPGLRDKGQLAVDPYPCIYFYTMNMTVKPLNDKSIRKALSYAIDRNILTTEIIKSSVVPAPAVVPEGIPDVSSINKDFRDIGGTYVKAEGQVEEAKKLMKEAGYPGGKGFPKISISYNDSGSHPKIAKAVQEMWKKNLGITVNLKAQDWEELQKSRNTGSFDIIRQGWAADYVDPLAFLSVFMTNCSNNYGKYSNSIYDGLITAAKTENDYAKKSRIMHQAEDILMDDMPVLPLFFYTDTVCSRTNIKGILRLPIGFTYFDQGYNEDAE